MTTLLFSNEAQTTLVCGITSTDTQILVASGTGAYFPQPIIGQVFKLTLVNSTNNLINEIVLCTHVATDLLTIVRGQEGTPARAWKAGDFVVNLMTAGTADSFAQIDDLESGVYPIPIGGFPVVITSPQFRDALMFGANVWENVPQIEIADGGNY